MNDYEFLLELIEFLTNNLSSSSYFFDIDKENKTYECSINCNDLFFWASADRLEITKDNFSLLKETYKELDSKYRRKFTGDLFACRVRKMKPQEACYKIYPKEIHHLFDACGNYFSNYIDGDIPPVGRPQNKNPLMDLLRKMLKIP